MLLFMGKHSHGCRQLGIFSTDHMLAVPKAVMFWGCD